jgi:hypothetical protein
MPETNAPTTFECASCHRDFSIREVELDAKLQPVCRRCYLSDVPEHDIDGMLHDAPHGNLKQ